MNGLFTMYKNMIGTNECQILQIFSTLSFLLLLLMVWSYDAQGSSVAEDIDVIVITGVADPADQYTYRLEEFTVPDGTGALYVEFD
jgi:hypothetical protein